MILNLANEASSDIKWKLINFPDGDVHINLINIEALIEVSMLVIKTRLRNTNDMFILRQAVDSIRKVSPHVDISCHIVYLQSARYDREMQAYDSCNLELVAEDINNLQFRRVVLYEPHSSASTSLIKRREVVHPLDKEVTGNLSLALLNWPEAVCFVSPDLGAVKRIEQYLTSIKKDIPIVVCNKHRILSTGVITGVDIFNPDLLTETVFLYDDLCDGGWTFQITAEKLRATSKVKRVFLFVPHGLFSKGTDILTTPNDAGSYVDGIWTTNSFKEIEGTQLVQVIKVI